MAAADVGDDVYSEDPTVAALEEEAARLVGKEAAVYTPSGTMGNQLAINLLTAPGTELVAVDDAHVRDYERAAASMISGVAFRTVAGQRWRDRRRCPQRAAGGGGDHPAEDLGTGVGEHPQRIGRPGGAARGHGGHHRVARQPRTGGPPRRRPVVQRGGGVRRPCRPICRPGRHRPVLLLQRARRPGGLDPLRGGGGSSPRPATGGVSWEVGCDRPGSSRRRHLVALGDRHRLHEDHDLAAAWSPGSPSDSQRRWTPKTWRPTW